MNINYMDLFHFIEFKVEESWEKEMLIKKLQKKNIKESNLKIEEMVWKHIRLKIFKTKKNIQKIFNLLQ